MTTQELQPSAGDTALDAEPRIKTETLAPLDKARPSDDAYHAAAALAHRTSA